VRVVGRDAALGMIERQPALPFAVASILQERSNGVPGTEGGPHSNVVVCGKSDTGPP
jgi:hypothetical protein